MNVCIGPPTSIRDLALAIGTAAGRRVTVKHGAARAGDIRGSLGISAKATALLGLAATDLLPVSWTALSWKTPV